MTFSFTLALLFVLSFQTVISDVDIQDIVDIFNLTTLDDLYPRLGLSETEIENAKLQGSTPKQKEKKVLFLWRNKKADKATREVMLEAMRLNKSMTAPMNEVIERWGGPTGKCEILHQNNPF